MNLLHQKLGIPFLINAVIINRFFFDFVSKKLISIVLYVLDPKSEIPASWQNRTATAVEETTAIKLQAWWRERFVMKCWNARKSGMLKY